MKGTAIRTIWAAALALLGAWSGLALVGVPTARAAEGGADVALVSVCRQRVIKTTHPGVIEGRFVQRIGNVGTAPADAELEAGVGQTQKGASSRSRPASTWSRAGRLRSW